MKYRPEVDGLRALAVVPVVLFHAGFETFSGGFTGVDIFFVISGYLITTILLEELRSGRFSILGFYERRARRILPALIFVIACMVPVAIAWMTPDQFRNFGQGLVAVSVFSSNVLFWRKADYFAPAAELNPLLHTWSLAVEEQFYLFFPLLLWILTRRLYRWRFTALVVLGVASFGLSEILSRVATSANFYLLPTRAWELMAGAVCAKILFERNMEGRPALSAVGLLMLLVPVFVFDESTRFPSVYALPTVVGTMLIILFSGQKDWVSRLLASRPLVAVGLISYSTYLWHQPLFAFLRIRSVTEPPAAYFVVLSVAALALGWFSWRFVERPFRKPVSGPFVDPRMLVAFCGSAFLVFVLAGLAVWQNEGYPGRLPSAALDLLTQKDQINPNRQNCHYRVSAVGRTTPDLPHPPCVFGPSPEPSVAVLGDSHADTLADAFTSALAREGITSTQITLSGCLPFGDYDRSIFNCSNGNREIFEYVSNSTIDTVVLIGRYASVYPGVPFDNGEGGVDPKGVVYDQKTFKFELQPAATYSDYSLELFRRGVDSYLDAGLRVVLVYPVPEAGWNVPHYLARKAWHDSQFPNLTTSYLAYQTRYEEVLRLFDSIEDAAIRRVRPAEVFCNVGLEGRCVNSRDGTVFYNDHNHLNQSGAALLVPAFLRAFHDLPLPPD